MPHVASGPARSRSLAGLLVALLSLLIVAPPVSRAAESTKKVTFGVQPAAHGKPDNRPFLTYGVNPGATVRDGVALLNYSARPLALRLVASDALATTDGSFSLASTAARPVDVGSWLTLHIPRTAVVVPPATLTGPGQVLVPITLVVPDSASPGDHLAGIAAVLTTRATRPGAPNVALEQRVATRVFVRVSGQLRANLVIERLEAKYRGRLLGTGAVRVTYRIRNAGNVKLGAKQQVDLTSFLGPKRTSRPKDLPLLFPGNSVTVTTDVTGVWPTIRPKATVRLLPLRLQGDVDPRLPVVVVATCFWAIPWLLIAILIGLLVAFVLNRRRLSRRPSPAGRHARPRSAGSAAGRERVGTAARVGVVLGLAGSLLVSGSPAHAESTPYRDPSSNGVLGFCDGEGHQVLQGRLTSRPLAAKVVLSSRAPAGYHSARATATLLAYQPRENVAPGQWSGEFLTGPSRFADPAHPAVAGALDDLTIGEFVQDFPPMLKGFVQLRVYFGAPGRTPYKLKYDSADLRVDGDRWTQVGSTSADCAAAKAVTVAQILGVAPTSTPSAAGGPTRPGTSAPSSGATGPAAAADDGTTRGSASGLRSTSKDLVLPVAGAILLGLLLFSGLLLLRRRPGGTA